MTSLLYPEENKKMTEMPYSTELEYGLLGWITIDNSLIDHLGFLRPDHFETPEHCRIYQAMLEMRRDGALITPFTMAQKITDFAEITQYMARACAYSNTVLKPLEEARYLLELAERRAIISACEKQIESLKQTMRSAGEHAAELTAAVEKIIQKSGASKFQTDVQVSRDILADIQSPQNPYSTGLRPLDTAMEGGLYPGMCYALLGRKKMGKSALAGTISCNLNQDYVKHLYIACEMGTRQIQQRNLSRLTQTYSSAFRAGYGKSANFQEKITDEIEKSHCCIIYLNAPGITFDELRRVVPQAISTHKIRGFFLDSLQLVGGIPRGKSKVDHYDDVAQWVADFSRQQNIFSVVTGQINQTGNVRFGEGIRLSCDQAYEIRAPEDDPSRSDRWLEMLETRYTSWMNVGSKESPGLLLNQKGPYFTDFGDTSIALELGD